MHVVMHRSSFLPFIFPVRIFIFCTGPTLSMYLYFLSCSHISPFADRFRLKNLLANMIFSALKSCCKEIRMASFVSCVVTQPMRLCALVSLDMCMHGWKTSHIVATREAPTQPP